MRTIPARTGGGGEESAGKAGAQHRWGRISCPGRKTFKRDGVGTVRRGESASWDRTMSHTSGLPVALLQPLRSRGGTGGRKRGGAVNETLTQTLTQTLRE